jgi:hypothetical protein
MHWFKSMKWSTWLAFQRWLFERRPRKGYSEPYEGVTKSFRTDRLERELQMVQLSATSCSCIATLWVSLVNFAAIILCVASQRIITKLSVYFVMDSVRKLLDTPSYCVLLRSLYVNVGTWRQLIPLKWIPAHHCHLSCHIPLDVP